MNRNTKVTKETYAKVMARDKVCQLCGSSHWLVEHHILYKSMSGNNSEQNLIVLCTSCHVNLVHANGKHYFPILLNMQRKHYNGLLKEDLRLKNKWE